MKIIPEIPAGYMRFTEGHFSDHQPLYEQLAEGQNPHTMIISCADSRVDPVTIFDGKPGDFFVVRNVANLVPPCNPDGGYHGTSAALEFAVNFLKVKHVLVLGHTQCGGIRACLHHSAEQKIGEFIDPWVNIAAEARDYVRHHHHHEPYEQQVELLEQEAIKLSIQNLMTFPFVQHAVEDQRLDLHGAIFGIQEGQLLWLDQQKKSFHNVTV